MDITIIIPTNRPHDSFVKNAISNINSFGSRYSYQIAVVSQEPIHGKNVVWVKEEGRMGPIAAFNKVSVECDSQYVACMVDDHIFASGLSDTIDFLKLNYQKKRFPITSLCSGPPNFNPLRGQLLGESFIDFDVKRFPLCKFPVFEKRALDELGGKIFHPDLFYHAGDILLGYYMGLQGEHSIDGPTVIRPFNPAKDSSFEVKDCETVKSIIRKYTQGETKYLA